MKRTAGRLPMLLVLALALQGAGSRAADETVSTAVYARIGNGYQRERGKDGAFQPEYYALSNGGKIYGTTADITVDRVTYPQVAEIAMRLLARENYHYAQSKEQAKLMIVLHWGNTLAVDRTTYDLSVAEAGAAYGQLVAMFGPQGMGSLGRTGLSASDGPFYRDGNPNPNAAEAFEVAMAKLMMNNRARDQLNERNARVLGYLDDLADSNDIRRWAGGGDRYNDLIGDVEESRYYIMISAYDFPELEKHGKKKLLWQVRVSVRTPGNAFDDSVVAMLKSASLYFGRDSGKLVRGEESKGTVELGELQYLGEAKGPKQTPTKKIK